MPGRLVRMAIAYDFDGTLAPGNMQEYEFVPNIGMKSKAFWTEVTALTKAQEADGVLSYMQLMLEKAANKKIQVRKENFVKYGESVKLFDGVLDWFDQINEYGKKKKINIEHYIISSGIREMIAGTPIATKFKRIFASSFMYDHHGIAHWPALAVNYTTKTQYLFRINKGALNVYDDSKINAYILEKERPVPFRNMVFIGDGSTDIPCFRLVKGQGGHSIAVYKPTTSSPLLCKLEAGQFFEAIFARKVENLLERQISVQHKNDFGAYLRNWITDMRTFVSRNRPDLAQKYDFTELPAPFEAMQNNFYDLSVVLSYNKCRFNF